MLDPVLTELTPHLLGFLPLIPLAISGLGALGGLFGNRSQTQKTTQNQQFANTGTSNIYNQAGSQTHTAYDPADLAYYNSIRDKYTNLMNTDPNLAGYQAAGLQDINRRYNLNSQGLNERLAASGQNGPALAANMANQNAGRFAESTRFRNSVPLLARTMQEDTLGKALTAFGMAPKDIYTDSFSGTNSTTNESGTSSGTGTQTTPGNMLGGGLGSLANLLAFFYGKGAFGGSKESLSY